MFASSIFVMSEYCKSNWSLQSWDKSLIIDFRHWKNITRANIRNLQMINWEGRKYIDKMIESSTMFPVKVTLNELPGQVFVSVSVCVNLNSFLRYYEFYRNTISLIQCSYHSWSSSISLLHKLMICKLYFEQYHVIPLPSPLEVPNWSWEIAVFLCVMLIFY